MTDHQEQQAEEDLQPPILNYETCFPTPFFYSDQPDAAQLNAGLLQAIRAEKDKDIKGLVRSNPREVGSSHSRTDLHRAPAFGPLGAQISEIAGQISQRLQYDPSYELSVDNMWAIVNPPGSFNRSHVHPNSMWSGVYYVQAPDWAGRISFTDPRTAHLMISLQFDPGQENDRQNWHQVFFSPIAGRVILFPAWLYHAVEPKMNAGEGDKADRICISFNLWQKICISFNPSQKRRPK